MPLVRDTKNPLALISAHASTDTFPPTDYSSPVRGCNIYSYIVCALKSQILLFCTITHAGLYKLLNNHSDLEVALVEAHIVDRLHPRICF